MRNLEIKKGLKISDISLKCVKNCLSTYNYTYKNDNWYLKYLDEHPSRLYINQNKCVEGYPSLNNYIGN